MKELITAIELAVPVLEKKIQPMAVDATTTVPYAAYIKTVKTPVRSKDGIVGYDRSFELQVVDTLYSSVEAMEENIIDALDGDLWQFVSSEDQYIESLDLYSKVLTFKILK